MISRARNQAEGSTAGRPWTLEIEPPVGASTDAEAGEVELDL